jgi:hypothetical protein
MSDTKDAKQDAKQDAKRYADGMSEYRRNNWKGRWVEPKELAKAAFVEFCEIFEELWYKLNLWSAFLEVWDVWHSIVNMLFVLVLGEMMKTPIPYMIIWFITPFTAYKHMQRYRDTGCIRSNGWHEVQNGVRIPIGHVCCLKKN